MLAILFLCSLLRYVMCERAQITGTALCCSLCMYMYVVAELLHRSVPNDSDSNASCGTVKVIAKIRGCVKGRCLSHGCVMRRSDPSIELLVLARMWRGQAATAVHTKVTDRVTKGHHKPVELAHKLNGTEALGCW